MEKTKETYLTTMYFTSLNLAIASKLRIRLLRHGVKAQYSNINDDSSIVNKFEASLTDDARVVIYDRRLFIVQATDLIIKPEILGN